MTYPPFANDPWPDYLTGGMGKYTYRWERMFTLVDINQAGMNTIRAWCKDKSNGWARHIVPELDWFWDPGNPPHGILDPALVDSAMQYLCNWDPDYPAEKYGENSKRQYLFRIWMDKFQKACPNQGHYFTLPSQRWELGNYHYDDTVIALNQLAEACNVFNSKQVKEWGRIQQLRREGGMLFDVAGDSVCLWSNFGVEWENPQNPDYNKRIVTGVGIMPVLVKITANGCDIQYTKAIDNCTRMDSYVWDSTYPLTTRWVDEQFLLWQ